MSARLFCRYGPLEGTEIEIEAETSVGRSQSNDLVLNHESVSKTHARIVRDDHRDCFVLVDLGSTNGTLLDGDRVARDERLGALHVISFGGSAEFIFVDRSLTRRSRPSEVTAVPEESELELGIDQRPEPSKTEPAEAAKVAVTEEATLSEIEVVGLPESLGKPEVEAIPEQTVMGDEVIGLPEALAEAEAAAEQPTPATFQLEVLQGKEVVDRFDLASGENSIGRGSDCDIQIDTEALSRKHASIRLDGSALHIRDLASTNGTFVDHRRLKGAEERELSPGSRVRLGATICRVSKASEEA